MIQTQAHNNDLDPDMNEKKNDRPDRYTAPSWLFGPPLDHSAMDLLAEAATICERQDAEDARVTPGIASASGPGHADSAAKRSAAECIKSDGDLFHGAAAAGSDSAPVSGPGVLEASSFIPDPQLLQLDIALTNNNENEGSGGSSGERKRKLESSSGTPIDGDHRDDIAKNCENNDGEDAFIKRQCPMERDEAIKLPHGDQPVPNLAMFAEESEGGGGTGGCESDEPAATNTAHAIHSCLGPQHIGPLDASVSGPQEMRQAVGLLKLALPGLVEACKAIMALGVQGEVGLCGLSEAVNQVQSACDLLVVTPSSQ